MHPELLLPAQSVEFAFSARLIVAVILGAVMGVNRSIFGKHAGMRTYALVSLGSCVFAIVGTLASYELVSFNSINPLQIASSVVVGIGFIGSGLAAFRGENPIELTTASGIWVVAAIGMACGYGLFILATTCTVLGILIFSLLSHTEHWLQEIWGQDVS